MKFQKWRTLIIQISFKITNLQILTLQYKFWKFKSQKFQKSFKIFK